MFAVKRAEMNGLMSFANLSIQTIRQGWVNAAGVVLLFSLTAGADSTTVIPETSRLLSAPTPAANSAAGSVELTPAAKTPVLMTLGSPPAAILSAPAEITPVPSSESVIFSPSTTPNLIITGTTALTGTKG